MSDVNGPAGPHDPVYLRDPGEPGGPRTVLLRGGAVHSPADPFASAMAVQDGQVSWVGSEGAADSFADGADEVVDLRGALVTPAFVDAHVHATATGLALSGLDLAGCPDRKSVV